MKILIPLKRVPDADTRIRIRPDGLGVQTEGIKYAANPFDLIALEEAIRMREKLGAAEIIAVSIGPAECQETLRTALAMGADRAILVRTDLTLDSLAVAKVLAAIYHRESPRLIVMGKQAIDDDSNQAGQMLAGLLALPQATFVSKVELSDAGATVLCSRETDAGIETVRIKAPAVITVDLRLNTPRYVSLPGIMKAKKKPIEELELPALNVEPKPRTSYLLYEGPPRRQAGQRVKGIDELISKLWENAKVI